MKRIISVFLTALICFSLAVPAFAADEVTEEKKTPNGCLYSFYTREEAEIISDRIADSAEYWPIITFDGYESVCAGVRISENPEIANPKVFRKTVVKMVDRCNAVIENPTENTILMNYQRFGGELAFHILAILFLDIFKGADIPDYETTYEMFDRADMNIDEERIPQAVMTLTGYIIMGLFP